MRGMTAGERRPEVIPEVVFGGRGIGAVAGIGTEIRAGAGTGAVSAAAIRSSAESEAGSALETESGGAVIALLHANGFPPGAYRALGAALAPYGAVHAMTTRPFWPNEPSEGLDDWRLLAEDALAWLDQVSPGAPVRAIGHSLGGVTWFYAALAAPERFESLVLVEPVFLPPALLAQLAAGGSAAVLRLPLVRGALQRREQWPDRAAAFAHWRPKPVFERFGDAALWDYVAAGTVPRAEGLGVTLACPRDWEAQIYATPPLDVWDRLPELAVPTLGLRGALTDTIFPEAWALWQRLQPAATFRELPGLGHLLPLEDGAAVGAVIGDWWAGTER